MTKPSGYPSRGTAFPGGAAPRRGIALLLVMVALVVGTILTAGFLATQSTANGITRNQKSVGQTRMIAEAGIDSCVWLIKNKSDWRRTMTPGNWISNMAVNGGTLTVNVVDAAGSTSFITDNTQSAIIQSTATYNGQSITVQAVITPSGGGTPWGNGLFVNSGPTLQNTSSIDAYNSTSSLGLYPLSRLLTAIVGTGGTGSGCPNGTNGSCGTGCGCGVNGCGANGSKNCQGGLIMKDLSSIYGTAMGVVGNLLNTLLSGLLTTPPSTVTTAPETRTLGTVMPPNIAGFVSAGAFSKNTAIILQPASGLSYDSFAIMKPSSGNAQMQVTKSAVYYVKGNLTLDINSVVKIATGNTLTFYVAGNTDIQGTIQTVGSGQFILYTAGSVNIHNAAVVNSQSTPGQALILGLPTSNSIAISNSSTVAAAIYAPKAVIALSNSAVVYGSTIGQSITMQNSSAIHLDDNLKTKVFHSIKGGSTMGDYNVTWVRSNGGNGH